MENNKRKDETIASSMEDVELSLEQLHFAPGDNDHYEQYTRLAEVTNNNGKRIGGKKTNET